GRRRPRARADRGSACWRSRAPSVRSRDPATHPAHPSPPGRFGSRRARPARPGVPSSASALEFHPSPPAKLAGRAAAARAREPGPAPRRPPAGVQRPFHARAPPPVVAAATASSHPDGDTDAGRRPRPSLNRGVRMKPFAMERWQSTFENRVAYNLSESGVHPLTLGELVEMAGASRAIPGTSLGYGQSNGSDELRGLIAALYPGATEANVVATNGSAEANFIAMWELLEGGGEAAIVMPAYMQTHGLADAFGAKVREIWLREEHGWQPDPDEIASAVTDRTRVVVITNPNNPTGAVLSAEARDALIRAADRAGAWILADEVYTGAELRGPETRTFWGDYPRVIATGSLSKAYGLPGLRIGWVT